jgi:SAM-dependent methyltransferase
MMLIQPENDWECPVSFLPRELVARAPAAGPIVDWEEVNCLLCGSHRFAHFLEARDNLAGDDGLWFAVVRCKDCGLLFTNPRPSSQSISHFYPEAYWPERAPKPQDQRRGRPRPMKRWCRPARERRILNWHGQGRLLDFGCGGGLFLERMHRQGWRVTGLDVSPAAVHEIRHGLKLQALVGSLPHPELSPQSFDVITMWHSLEHVHQPLVVLQQARSLLAPGGKLLIAIPNIDSLAFRWFGSCWYALDLPRHLTHFSSVTISWMLQRAGFRVDSVRMIPQSGWLRSSAQLSCRKKSAPAWHHWLRGKPISRVVTGFTSLTRQSDCILVTAQRSHRSSTDG